MSIVHHAKQIDGFVLQETIGHGTYAKVKIAVHRVTHEVIAIKIIQKNLVDPKQISLEVQLHESLSHPNIIRLLKSFNGTNFAYILMEYALSGELFESIVPDLGVDELVAHFYFNQLIGAVSYIHQMGICHRDLKPENLLIDQDGNLKIGDFGLATRFMINGMKRKLNSFCGTPPYVAPEILEGGYDEAVDIWSCGIILYVLMTGNTPWEQPVVQCSEFGRFYRGDLNFEPWTKLSLGVKSLILGMLVVDPPNRMTIPEIQNHPWFRMKNPLLGPNNQCQDTKELAARLNITFSDIRRQKDNFASLSQPLPQYSSQESNQSCNDDMTISLSQPIHLPHMMNRFFTKADATFSYERLFNALKFLGAQMQKIVKSDENSRKSSYKIGFSLEDRRKCLLKGVTKVVSLTFQNSLILFQRRKGDPLEFKRLFLTIKKSLSDLIVADST